MKIRLTLNGKKVEGEIKADTLLLDFVREKAAIASSADARPPTAAFVLYGWMESRFCHVPHLPFVQMDVM